MSLPDPKNLPKIPPSPAKARSAPVPEIVDTPEGFFECVKCCRELPHTAQYFDRDEDKPSGLKNTCKECRAHERMAKETAEAQKVVKKLDKLSIELIEKASHKDMVNVPHVATMLEELMAVYGGAEGFAKQYMANYLATRPGSQIRARMLDGILNLTKEVTRSGSADLPLDRLEDSEVDGVVDSIERRLLKKLAIHNPQEDDEHIQGAGPERPASDPPGAVDQPA
jgi:hypothetical protein